MLRMQGDGLGGVRGRSCQKPCPRQQPLLWDPGVALSVTDNPGLGTDHCFLPHLGEPSLDGGRRCPRRQTHRALC